MKVRVTLKDPDTMHDAVNDAAHELRLACPIGVSEEEWRQIRAQRAAETKDEIASRWMRYGEYLTVEFDTEAGTATVIENKDLR